MSQINQIEAWACEIAGDNNPVNPAPRSLIRKWSAFTTTGSDKTIDIGQKTLWQIKPGWVQSIYWRAQKAIVAHRKAAGQTTLDMPLPEKVPLRARKQAVGVRMPCDGPENRPEDLPF
jgi:hypothetical protein